MAASRGLKPLVSAVAARLNGFVWSRPGPAVSPGVRGIGDNRGWTPFDRCFLRACGGGFKGGKNN